MSEMTKIKFDLGYREVRNCYAKVEGPFKDKTGYFYRIYFDDGLSSDEYCKFDAIHRCFYGAN